MDLSRLASVVDTERMRRSRVALVGVGGGADLGAKLCRCGVGRFVVFDNQRVEAVNIARQHHDQAEIGAWKVDSFERTLRRINPAVEVERFTGDFMRLSDEQLDARLGGCDLLILATDQFRAQAQGNRFALRRNIPAIWLGLYAGGSAGEIIFWHRDIDACYRCLCARRYRAHDAAEREGRSLDPPSDGCTVFDVAHIDAIAGDVALGLLNRGCDNRFGRLIEALGDRNFIQVQRDPEWTLNGTNPVRTYLQVPISCGAFVAWNAIARRDPDCGQLYCQDCVDMRHDAFTQMHGIPVRLRGDGRIPVQSEEA
jgi:molybdopterin/thiamine biosynthesis adenylyltransferase